jgi:flagellar FliJ protein
MPFRFRLQKVLDYRQKLVDAESREVGQAARVVARIQERMGEVEARTRAVLGGGSLSGSSLAVADMQQRRLWLDHLARRKAVLGRELDRAVIELEKRRAALTEVWRDLEVLKKLKERQREAWQADQLRRENQDLDEIGQIRADRRNREMLASRQA